MKNGGPTRLSKALGGRTLDRAIEIVEQHMRDCETKGVDPSNRVVRLGRYLHWQWRVTQGSARDINFGSDQ